MTITDQPAPARRRRRLALAGTVAAVGMTVLWSLVVPDKADHTSGLQSLAIRWGHPATWALLAALGVLVATDAPKRIRAAVGYASLGCYGAFWAGLLL